MLYDRKIKYLDYCEDGERIRGGGFVKMEVRDGNLRMELKVTGLHPTDSFDREILLRDDEKEKALGSMAIAGGKGQYLQLCRELDNIGGTGIGYEALRGIRIPLGAGREISCILQPARMMESGGKKRGGELPAGKAEKGALSREERYRNGRKVMAEKELMEWPEAQMNGGQRGVMQAASREILREVGQREEPEEIWHREGMREAVQREEAEESGRREGMREAVQREEAEEIWRREGMRGAVQREEAEEIWRREGMREAVQRGEAEEIWRRREMRESGQKKETEEPGRREGMREEVWRREGMREVVQREETDQVRKASRREAERWEDMREAQKKETMGEAEPWKNAKKVQWREEKVRKSDISEQGRGIQEPEKPVPQLEDKWAQLWSIYPHIHPFRDEREYLSIRPSDFVLLPSASYKMANNSFLLHGYYNYHHLLLGRVEKKGEFFYYIGVPGNFYEREKQVAIMFGFESFECAEEPAQAGDFGYYMMRTQL